MRQAGAIEMVGKIEGRGPIALATTDVGLAVRGATLVMVVIPGDAHAAMAESLAPHVTDAQTVVLHPGGKGGALELAATFQRLGVARRPRIAEVESFTFGSKTVGSARSQVGTVKLRNRIAALPARDTAGVLALLRDDFPQFVSARNVLQTSLNHMNAMMHVAGMVMNAGWVDVDRARRATRRRPGGRIPGREDVQSHVAEGPHGSETLRPERSLPFEDRQSWCRRTTRGSTRWRVRPWRAMAIPCSFEAKDPAASPP